MGATVDSREFAIRTRDAGKADFSPALKQCQIAIVAATKDNFERGSSPDGERWPPVNRRIRQGSINQPLRDRGLLMASITAAHHPQQTSLITRDRLVFGTNLDYAPIHQYGGTIKPVKAKALSIPLTVEAYHAGSPRSMKDLSMVWPKGKDKGWLVSRKGKKTTWHYLLVKSVTIPARPFLGWNDELQEECESIVADFVVNRLTGEAK